MSQQRVTRRLAAILAADVAGYSRLMGADETGTLTAMKAHRRELWTPTIEKYDGRVVGTAGDSILVEFASAVAAVECAVAVQQGMAERNANLPSDRRMLLRVGINIGEVIVDGEDIFGDGVNVAARVQEVAEPGGVCISGTVHEHVSRKLDFAFEDAGEHRAKNIAQPIHIWRLPGDISVAAATASGRSERLPLPDKPSIAVLPFDNMSGDPDQEYFADGLTEDIITELSRFQSFFVIARNSAFTYKGKAVMVPDVGRELGVHYVVEGSVRKVGNRVRVAVQLIDAASGTHVWAERYDHQLTDILDLQDEITQSIVSIIPGRLEKADLTRVKRKRPENMVAYDYLLRGRLHHHRGSKEDNAEAIRLLDKAIELDPEFAEAYAWKSCTYGQALGRGYGDNAEELFARDVEAAEKALSLDENNIECQWIMCELHMMGWRLDRAERHHQKAFTLNPNDPRIVAQRGELLMWQGRPVEGAEWVRRAMRLDPYDAGSRAHNLGRALFVARDYEEAIEAFKGVPAPRYGHHADMAACHAQLGNDEEAKRHARDVLRLKPDFSIADFLKSLSFAETTDRKHHEDGLRKAGLPE